MPEEKKRLYAALPAFRKGFEPCGAIAVPPGLMFAYKANAMVVADYDGTVNIERVVYLCVATDDYVVTAIMQFLKRAWLWSSEGLVDMPDYVSCIVKSGRGLLPLLLFGVIDKVHRVRVCQMALLTQYSLVRALVAILCL